MLDLGAHPVYILPFLLGQPKRVSGMMTSPYGTSSDENAIAVLEYENGALAVCETAFVTYGTPDLLEVYGTEGSVFIHGNRTLLSQKGLAELGVTEIEPSQFPETEPSPALQFIEACVNRTAAPAKFGTAAALSMSRIMEAAYISQQSGAVVQL